MMRWKEDDLLVGGKALIESPEEMDLSYLMKSRILYVREAYPSVVLDSIGLARKGGISLISNLGVNLSLFGREALKIAAMSDLVLVGSRELSLLGDDIVGEAISILKRGPKAIIVTMGSKGSMLVKEDGIKKVSAFKTKVIDTTGAGDVFTAGFIFGLLKGWDLLTCMRFGSAAAAIKVGSFGARSGLPTEKEVMGFLSRH